MVSRRSGRRQPGLSFRAGIVHLLTNISLTYHWIGALFGAERSPTSTYFPTSVPRPLANAPIIGPWLYKPEPPPPYIELPEPWWPCHGALAAIASAFALAWCSRIAFQSDDWPDGTILCCMAGLLVILIISVRQLPRAHKAWTCGLVAALLLWFDPAVLAVSHVWPQWDVWPVPFFLVSAFLASVEWWMTAGIVLAFGVMFKGQLLLPGPVLLFWPLFGGRIGPCLRALSGFIFGAAVALSPFLISQVTQIQWIAMSAVALLMTGALVLSYRTGGWLRIIRHPAAALTAIGVGVLAWHTPQWIPITGRELTYFRVFSVLTVQLGLASLIVRFIFWILVDADRRRVARLAKRPDPFANAAATPQSLNPIPYAQPIEPPVRPPSGAGLTGMLFSTFIIAAVLAWANCFAHYFFPTLPPIYLHDKITGAVTTTITGSTVTTLGHTLVLLFILGIPWLLPRRALIPWFFASIGLVVWISAFGIVPAGTTDSGYNGDFGWYHVGFVYGTYKFQVMQMGGNTFSNLPSILAVRYGWQIHDIVFRLDLPFLHQDVEMKTLLVSMYFVGLFLSAAGAAVHSRRNDPRALIALAAPWMLFPVLLTQMSERYLLMSSALSIAAIAASTELSIMHIVVALVGGAMALNQAMVQRGGNPENSFMPSVSWLITGSHPDMGFLTTALAIIFLVAAITPKPRWPRWSSRSRRPEPTPRLLPTPSLA